MGPFCAKCRLCRHNANLVHRLSLDIAYRVFETSIRLFGLRAGYRWNRYRDDCRNCVTWRSPEHRQVWFYGCGNENPERGAFVGLIVNTYDTSAFALFNSIHGLDLFAFLGSFAPKETKWRKNFHPIFHVYLIAQYFEDGNAA